MMHDNKPFLFCHQTCLRVETMEPGMKQNIPVNLKFNKNCLGLFLINETNIILKLLHTFGNIKSMTILSLFGDHQVTMTSIKNDP